MTKDLRGFLKLIEEKYSDQFLRIREEVDLRFEMTSMVLEFEKMRRYPILFFEKPKGFSMPVVTNVNGSRSRMAIAMETTEEGFVREWLERERRLFPPRTVASGPVKEITVDENEVDLKEIPILTHFQQDAGPYLTGAVYVAKDPDTGVVNTSFHRSQLKGKSKLGTSLHSRRHLWDYQRRAEERNQPLEVAIVLGYHPIFALGSTYSIGSIETDHFQFIGGLMNEPVEIVQCEHVDLQVPAHAEMVIEGVIPPKVREPEGPFGEFTGYATGRSTEHVVQVKGIMMREDAIYQDVVSGFSAEHTTLGVINREAAMYKAIKQSVPSVRAVHYPISGTGRFSCYIAIRKIAEGQSKNAIFAAFAADYYPKLVVVVDDDINIYDETEVLWAIATRVQPGEDVFITPKALGWILDPSCEDGTSSRMGIDATKPLSGFAEKCTIPDEVTKKVRDMLQLIPMATR